MKSLKTFKTLAIIVISVIVLVGILKFFNLGKEGFDSDGNLADYTDPDVDTDSCSVTNNGSSNVPGCYATLKTDADNDYFREDSDFILKTQIVPDVCPNNSSEYTNGGFGSLLTDDTSISTPDSTWLQSGTSMTAQSSVPNTDLSNDSTPSTIESPFTIQPDLAQSSPQNNTPDMMDIKLNYPSVPAPSSTDTMNSPNTPSPPESTDSKCPPCPACQRCPEPIVECKKVVNYDVAGRNNKLPLPYINDFSKF